jgi:hypothetical protein
MTATAVLGGWNHTAWGQEASQPAIAVKVYNYAGTAGRDARSEREGGRHL